MVRYVGRFGTVIGFLLAAQYLKTHSTTGGRAWEVLTTRPMSLNLYPMVLPLLMAGWLGPRLVTERTHLGCWDTCGGRGEGENRRGAGLDKRPKRGWYDNV